MTIQFITPFSVRLGVVGAGTMGRGIALTALYAGMPVTLFDVAAGMLDGARTYVEGHLARKEKSSHLQHLSLTNELGDLRKANLVIEAIPEVLPLKQDLFARLDEICPAPAVLATNTSTLAVTAIAAAAKNPQRVAGMHFFNPAPVMQLVEVVRAAQSSPETIQSLVTLAERLGKTPVVVRDTPGFIVNRVARPFYGEALRLLGEGVATHEEIDQIVRLGGGFKMGPFQLMDLIGIDVNLAATQSLYEQTFGEPRYRPHHIQAQMVQEKALGRKSGRGFYTYDTEPSFSEPRLPHLSALEAKAAAMEVYFVPGGWAPGLWELCQQSGYALVETHSTSALPISPRPNSIGLVAAGNEEQLKEELAGLERLLPARAPILCQCADVTITELSAGMRFPDRLVGFDGLFLAAGRVATLVASPGLGSQARLVAEDFLFSLGRGVIWIDDAPGLVLPRIVSMLANEAAFAAGEGVAQADQVDQAMQLGANYPIGPHAWGRQLGFGRVVAVLDHLRAEYGEERYRVAPLLRRWARLEQAREAKLRYN